MTEAGQSTNIVAVPKREAIIVQSEVLVLDTGIFEQMQRIAKIMASTSLVPAHLNRSQGSGQNARDIGPEEAVANCFLVVDQAFRWKMDPFAVAQSTFVVHGRLGFEGKLIAAVINTHPNLARRLSYEYAGSGKERRVTVTGRVKGDERESSVEGTVGQWQTSNEQWSRSPDQMLAYRGAREWARRWMPEAILGVYADDEIEDIPQGDRPPITGGGHLTGTAALRFAAETAGDGPGDAQPSPPPPSATPSTDAEAAAQGLPGADPEVLALRVADHAAALDEATTAKEVEDLARQVPADVRAAPAYLAAVAKRREDLSGKGKK